MPDQPLRPMGNVHMAIGARSLLYYGYRVRQIPAEQKHDVQPQLDALVGSQRRIVELHLERACAAVKDARSFGADTGQVGEYTRQVCDWLTQYGMPLDGVASDPLPVMTDWLELAKKYGAADSFGGYWVLHDLSWQFRYKPKLPPPLYEQYRKVWDLMEQHPLPQVRFGGKLGASRPTWNTTSPRRMAASGFTTTASKCRRKSTPRRRSNRKGCDSTSTTPPSTAPVVDEPAGLPRGVGRLV